ncbi:KpsF/GutQ family sugar-phosphate isomerase [Gilvimarinus agarilyticus]|uniref:KpsF/GutQ family sugar-phosphate isomerase n=1 Tax=Gilvimarinus sp. 2_MG-2023 TaxID=3062666 RepID=UPI001C09B0A8|nr:KpsF/GutQ family sugar-phosphate isomerase [Gilvimarinus sp. 2_MG-2023]MBU2885446.1 KpsF/GutQ family sugar-phosphate isomerase [Gilvimarinus agarilyticus]MDO6570346.1 KpsF/GutQ family sugar-phosphate isomerase [Gilvimarinus sp. 2_MG-2023]
MTDFDFIASAKRTIEQEALSVAALGQRVNGNFARACQLMLGCKGRVIVSGMGKSGHMGKKIAATLASTGTPAFFMHPGEASHGDLGMLTRDDILLPISYSGNSSELITLLPLIKRLGVPMIALTANPDSTLAKSCDIHLSIEVEREACPLALAPTSSATVTTVLGDALAIALLEARGFTAEDFAFSHPGGTLGRKLLLKIEDLMHTGPQLPISSPEDCLSKALLEMSSKGFGMTTVLQDDKLIGIFTDGDLRRQIDKGIDIHSAIMRDIMTPNPTTIARDTLAAEALKVMEEAKITALVVTEGDRACGILHMHDLLRAGVV